MINIPRITLAWLLLCSVAFAQSTSVSTPQALTGLDEPIQKIGKFLLVGPASKPVVAPVGLIELQPDDPAKPITGASVSAADKVDGKWVIVQASEEEPNKFVIAQQGDWLILIDGVNVKPPKQFTLVIGPPPPPPDVLGCTDPKATNYNPLATKDDGSCQYPTPPVPTDPFDNIGQRVAGWSVDLSKRKEVAEAYRLGAWQLANPPPQPVPPNYPITINEVAAQIGVTKAQVLGLDSVKWKALTENVNADTQGRWPMDRLSLSEYWVCVALGLEAQ